MNEGDAEARLLRRVDGREPEAAKWLFRFAFHARRTLAEFVGSTGTSDFSDHFKIQRRSPGPPPRGALDGGTMLFNRR